MTGFLALRLRGPMMGVGGTRIDGHPAPLPIPTRSSITGLLGAALGIDRADTDTLQALQDHMSLGVVVHSAGVPMRDYQTTDLSQPHLQGPMWWRDGRGGIGIVERGGANKDSTTIQERPYLCDVDMTVVLELLPGAPFTAEDITAALEQPAFPIFLGTTGCPPSYPIAAQVLNSENLEDAVSQLHEGDETIWLPRDAITKPKLGDLYRPIADMRDWTVGRHGGETIYVTR